MTEKLYYTDSHLFTFEAVVTDCREGTNGWTVELDRTAFFPEGGGQPADTGRLGPARVLDVRETDGRILHVTDKPLTVGECYSGRLDAEQRRRRMQNHSGEHIVSGLVHKLHGYENVGFHMGESCMSMDYSGELSREELERIELMANEAVRGNLPVRAWFPEPRELELLPYRSKKELREAVRLVEIPGIDRCACCAPHVRFTGEIGVIKILDAERHRGGVRLSVLCGLDALADYRKRQEGAAAVSALLSVPRDKIAPAVERLLGERDGLKERVATLSLRLVEALAAGTEPTEGNLCVFNPGLDEIAARELTNRLMERCGGFAGVFTGSDAEGWRYILGSRHVDLRAHARELNAALQGRGGGRPEMIQGQAAAPEAVIRAYAETAVFENTR